MALLAPKGPLVGLGDIVLAGETLRCVGSCMPGQGPRAGKSGIFPSAVLRHPIDTHGEAECRWYIAELKRNSGVCLGVSTFGEHAAVAEDWAGAGKAGHVWYVIIRGSEPKGRAGGGSFMDGGRVVSTCSALFGYPCFWRRRMCSVLQYASAAAVRADAFYLSAFCLFSCACVFPDLYTPTRYTRKRPGPEGPSARARARSRSLSVSVSLSPPPPSPFPLLSLLHTHTRTHCDAASRAHS